MPDAVMGSEHTLAPSRWSSRSLSSYRCEPLWDADAERQRAEEMSEHFERRRRIAAQVEHLQLAWRPFAAHDGADAASIDIPSSSEDAWEPLLMSPGDARFDGAKFGISRQLQQTNENRASSLGTSFHPTPGPSSVMDDPRNYVPAFDAMSYEDLLDLSDRVGLVQHAGATRRAINAGLERSRFLSMSHAVFASSDLVVETRCHICLEDYKHGDNIAKGRNCIHVGHVKCLEAWLLNCNSCPLCRSLVV